MKVSQPNGDMENVDSKDLKNMTGKTEIVSKEETMSANRKLTEAEQYNESILKIEDQRELDKFELMGNSMLFRPFKLVEEVSEAGLTLTEQKEEFMNKSSMKMGFKDLAFPYQMRGVVIKLSKDAEQIYEGQIKVGTIVNLPTLSMTSIPNMLFKMNKNNWLPEDNEKYLTLLTSGNRIDSYEPGL